MAKMRENDAHIDNVRLRCDMVTAVAQVMRNKAKKCKVSAILPFFFPYEGGFGLDWHGFMSELANERIDEILMIFQETEMTEDYMESEGQLTGKHVRKSWLDYVKADKCLYFTRKHLAYD